MIILNRKSMRSGEISVAAFLLIAAMVIGIIVMSSMVTISRIEGNEVGVLETMDGVSDTPLQPGTHFFFGFGKHVTSYQVSGQLFAINDKAEPDVVAGRRVDSLPVNTLDNQKITFNALITWHRDGAHIVEQHKHYRKDIEETLLRPEISNEISVRATMQNAIDLYSGPKLNELRTTVTTELRSPTGKLATNGVMIDRVVIDRPTLDPKYEALIEQRQIAIAQESQAKEQQKANQAIADAAKTAALKEQYEREVAAQTEAHIAVITQQAASDKATIQTKADALNTITQQEAAARVVVINANAEADRQVAISEATKKAEINRAVGIKAVGEAQADAQKMLLSSYAVSGSDLYTRVKVAESMSTAFQGIKGYLPQGMGISVLSGEFDKAINVLAPMSTVTR